MFETTFSPRKKALYFMPMVKKLSSQSEYILNLALDDMDDKASVIARAAKDLGLQEDDAANIEIKKRSIDARRGKVSFVFTIGPRDHERKNRLTEKLKQNLNGKPVIIVGAGPAGIFCAYELAKKGIKSIICERGKQVQERRKDLKGLNQYGIVDEDSNYCFGEGGAGTYSDGKLYTRSHKRGNVADVLETLVSHGAPESILTDARPHIGSNKLPKVITALRHSLESVGVQFIFNARVIDFLIENKRACGVRLKDGREILGQAVVLATGHSARDIYELCHRIGLKLEAKAFALGVRIEHPQAHINQIQYGRSCGHPKLPPAYYRLAHTAQGRGVFSFCMCPGGWIVPAATSQNALVINGMSLSKRDSPFANSGLVVSVSPEDLTNLYGTSPLAGLYLQDKVERKAFIAGGGNLVAPAVRIADFLAGKISQDLPKTSYLPGLKSASIDDILHESGLALAEALRDALKIFGRNMPGFISEEAVMLGLESRTSSPVRIERDAKSLSSSLKGLYPCGEGAGYAGGIVSAALDGVRVAEQISIFITD
jgi:uncharacterized FAD-dependent dehydrogenase